jgi:hypothetical protein
MATLAFDSGLTASIDVCGRAGSRRLFAAVGDRGAALVDASSRRSSLWVTRAHDFTRLSSAWKDAAAHGEVDAFSASPKALGTSFEAVPLPDIEPLRAEMDAFVQAVMHGVAHPTTALDGVQVTRVMSRIDAAVLLAPDRVSPRRGEDANRTPAPAFP